MTNVSWPVFTNFHGNKMTFDKFFKFLESTQCFEEHDVSIIDKDGLQHYVDQSDYYSYLAYINKVIAAEEETIKVEQMERYWKFSDRTIHLFYNPKNGPTFDLHTDPTDVVIECKDGTKAMDVNGYEVILMPGDKLLIHAGTEHKALNYEKALMASHAIGDTETLNRLRENN